MSYFKSIPIEFDLSDLSDSYLSDLPSSDISDISVLEMSSPVADKKYDVENAMDDYNRQKAARPPRRVAYKICQVVLKKVGSAPFERTKKEIVDVLATLSSASYQDAELLAKTCVWEEFILPTKLAALPGSKYKTIVQNATAMKDCIDSIDYDTFIAKFSNIAACDSAHIQEIKGMLDMSLLFKEGELPADMVAKVQVISRGKFPHFKCAIKGELTKLVEEYNVKVDEANKEEETIKNQARTEVPKINYNAYGVEIYSDSDDDKPAVALFNSLRISTGI